MEHAWSSSQTARISRDSGCPTGWRGSHQGRGSRCPRPVPWLQDDAPETEAPEWAKSIMWDRADNLQQALDGARGELHEAQARADNHENNL